MDRRTFISSVAATSVVAKMASSNASEAQAAPDASVSPIAGPPVIQNPTPDSISIAWQVNTLATGHVEWGTTKELGNTAVPSHHGLAQFDEKVLSVQIKGLDGVTEIYYRIVVTPVTYKNAYQIVKHNPVMGEIRKAKLPSQNAKKISIAVVNDTHEHEKTIAKLADRIDEVDPDLLFWNGDISNNFRNKENVAKICLSPGADPKNPEAGGWASTRPLLFVAGNHDARGRHAQDLSKSLTPWPMQQGDPEGLSSIAWHGGRYCFALRHGPVALIGLDTGEDKPDARPVFAGLAAFEPYRRAQEQWLIKALAQPEIASAPHLVAFAHIPLRGLPGHNDGQTDSGYAYYSGQGQDLWLPHLIKAKCKVILSGHTHRMRSDAPTEKFPIRQIVGGGPKLHQARLIRIEADANNLTIKGEDLDQKIKGKWDFTSRF